MFNRDNRFDAAWPDWLSESGDRESHCPAIVIDAFVHFSRRIAKYSIISNGILYISGNWKKFYFATIVPNMYMIDLIIWKWIYSFFLLFFLHKKHKKVAVIKIAESKSLSFENKKNEFLFQFFRVIFIHYIFSFITFHRCECRKTLLWTASENNVIYTHFPRE